MIYYFSYKQLRDNDNTPIIKVSGGTLVELVVVHDIIGRYMPLYPIYPLSLPLSPSSSISLHLRRHPNHHHHHVHQYFNQHLSTHICFTVC